ncbi:Lipid-A-disaccharide synthase [Triticum urartu]|uniref:lipid-A-disaccharide synthase n=1 Tax=Triticum urartu TaxID=4572 RepID=M7ZGW2_TRIUA|nr:Lipid-A-disaccharide synthase [Triticum urartu]
MDPCRRAPARAAGQVGLTRLFLREGVRRSGSGRRTSGVRCRRELMCKEGLQSLFPMEEIAIMGLWELLPHIYNVKRKIKDTLDAAILFRPHAVVTVDSKGFSFRLLQQLKCRYNQKVDSPLHVHYVAPSFWAWKGGESRLSKLHNFVDHMLCILPFEDEICRLHGLPATYVGHPLLDDAAVLNVAGTSLQHKNVDSELSPDMSTRQRSGEAFRLEHGLSPVIPVAPHRDVRTYVENVVRSVPFPVVLIPGGSLEKRYGAFNASKAALCTSGTAVMELMLAKLPCVVAYQAHFLTECFIHLRKKINFISLPNILLDSPIVPEILFRACTDKNLAAKLSEVIFNDEVRQLQVGSAERMLQVLYEPIKRRGNLFAEELGDLGLSSDVYSPGTIAALTVLYMDKNRHRN